MEESDLNKTVKDSILHRGGFAYKISDASGAFGQKRPFDGFGVLKDKNIYWEGKAAKGIKPFNLKKVFEGSRGHQMETLEIFRTLAPDSELWVPYLCYIPRKSRVYLFSYESIRALFKEDGVQSIHAKILEKLPYKMMQSVNKTRIIIGELVPISVQELRQAYIREES